MAGPNLGPVSAMIEARDLRRAYGPTWAVRGLSFGIEAGEVVGFLGPNGAGKTTTMRMLAGTLRPTGGTVRVGGFDLASQAFEAKALLGYLPERPPLDPEMRVAEYLEFAAALRGLPAARRASAVDRALERTATGAVAHRLIGHLSKGFQQRVGLAQALVHEPRVLILDEPTAGLDPEQIQDVRSLIAELRGEHTVLLSTHILQEVTATCERALIVDRGRLVVADTLEGLRARVRSERRLRLTVARPGDGLRPALLGLAGVVEARGEGASLELVLEPEVDAREAVAQAVVAGGHGLLELVEVPVALEDAMLRLLRADRGGGS
jgi:ABC-2 type transport system ATP-binding protein